MADSVQFQAVQLATPASGTTISTDESSSGHIQRVKLAFGADGSDAQVPADADGLRVNTGAHLDDVHNPMDLTDQGLATKSAIFGYTTSGGGSYEPVKVNPSGSLAVEATQASAWEIANITGTVSLPTGAATDFSLRVLGSNLASVTAGSNLLVTDSGLSRPISSSAAETYSVDDQTASAVLLDANPNRRGWAIYNDSTQACYLKLGTAASSTSFTVKLVADAYYEQAGHGVYTGEVSAAWAANGSGAARVTEW